MDWLLFQKGTLKNYLDQVQESTGLTLKDLGKELGISSRTLRDWKKEKYKPSKKLLLRLNKISSIELPNYQVISQQEHLIQTAKSGGQTRYRLYGAPGTKEGWSKGGNVSWLKRKSNPALWQKYTKAIIEPEESIKLAELMGILLGDGGLTSSQCTIYLNSETDQEFARYVSSLMLELFNVSSKIYIHRRNKVWRVSISSVNLVKYLVYKGLCIGNKVHLQVNVPSWIKSNSEYTQACIRGLIDTDGSFVIHKYKVKGKEYSYPKLNFTNRSEPLLNFVYSGLKQLGFNPKIQKYEVCLYNQNEVKRYLQEIGIRNYRPTVKKILEGDSCGKENGLLNHHDE